MIGIMVGAPMALGVAAEYAACRFPKKRFWRVLPPLISAAAAAGITLARYRGWDEAGTVGAPLETLLFFPGLPALALAIGLFLGWRLYKFIWTPKIVKMESGQTENGPRDPE